MVDVSVVIPVYNQGDHLRQLVATYVEVLGRLGSTWELVVVPNGCTDDTVSIAQDIASSCDGVRVVVAERGGWGHAVRTGVASARGESVCYTNSARTTARELALCLLYAKVNDGVVVKANRKIRENWKRRLGSLIYNLEGRALFDLSQWDVNGTPKVFPREFGELLDLRRDDDLIDLEFAAVCRREGYPIIEVPIFSTRRHGGKSTTNYGSAWRMYAGAWNLHRSMKRDGTHPAGRANPALDTAEERELDDAVGR